VRYLQTMVALSTHVTTAAHAASRGHHRYHTLNDSPLTCIRDGPILVNMETTKPLIPLTPAVFYILLALAAGERHGYQIMKQVKQDSQDQVKMGTGTLYGSLKRMLADGLIVEAGDRPDPALDDERRRYYQLTDLGRRAFEAELRRYAEVVSLATQRRFLPQPS
jgi:DNA-binding PadR family transcriptional regulator